jgi:hypothetical protein
MVVPHSSGLVDSVMLSATTDERDLRFSKELQNRKRDNKTRLADVGARLLGTIRR